MRIPDENEPAAVMTLEDEGVGHVERFSAQDLDHLYLQGGVDIAARISGKSLNKILSVTVYEADTWYVVTANGVEKF
jgi:hypothetical protein